SAFMVAPPARARSWLCSITREPNAAHLPARRRREEVAIAEARVAARRKRRGAAQHQLVAHELAVVLAERARRRTIAGIGRIGAARPLPALAEPLGQPAARRRRRMQPAALDEAAVDSGTGPGTGHGTGHGTGRRARGRVLPFVLARQARVGPA